MKMIRFASFMLLLTLAIFLVNGFADGLPKHAITRIDTGEGPVNAIAYSRAANRLAVAAADKIHIYDTSTYKELMVFAEHTDSVLTLAFSPNGKLLVSGSSDETVRLWNADTGKPIRTLHDHTGPVSAVAFSADGKAFWTAGNQEARFRSWYSADGGLRSIGGDMPTEAFTATAFSHNGSVGARALDSESVLDKGMIEFLLEDGWKLESSIVYLLGYDGVGILSAHADSVNVLTLYAEREVLATGSADKTIQLWNMADTKKPFHILAGHTKGITAMDFSINSKLLASGSSDKTVRLWDVATGQHRHTLTGHTGEIGTVTFLGDKALAATAFAKDKALASGSSDGTVFIWNLDKVVSTD